MTKKELTDYYKDQISFYENRKKKIEKNIADKERVGLPVSDLDQLQLIIEELHIKEFTTSLNQASVMKDDEINNLIQIIIKNPQFLRN